ncbi:MAG: sulfurtransferase complex subunit TusB [Proteobacteria bacterium]|jgi:tRNA 2-thiouridine synthesizing protein B|nr:sulfurtransferase complex subunit TusB [Pseudomonadota bacterium]MDA1290838.1 sulfurtransferase complex subunit TusB [Pseudomonadota bacterium]
MSCLHTINRSPDSKLLESCLKVINADDAILFIEDGVYHCFSLSNLPSIIETVKLYGLREDMLARATLSKTMDRVEVIDTARFVELSCEHDKVVSWF